MIVMTPWMALEMKQDCGKGAPTGTWHTARTQNTLSGNRQAVC